MKKIFSFYMAIILGSCTSLPIEKSISVYGDFPVDTPVYIEIIQLEPPQLMVGLKKELPDIIMSSLARNGFTISHIQDGETANMEFFIYKNEYQCDFKTYESVTLTISVKNGGKTIAYSLYTEDTDKSLDSFARTWSLLELNIAALAEELLDSRNKK